MILSLLLIGVTRSDVQPGDLVIGLGSDVLGADDCVRLGIVIGKVNVTIYECDSLCESASVVLWSPDDNPAGITSECDCSLVPMSEINEASQAENDDPQPHEPVEFGLLNLKPDCILPSM